MDNNKLIQVISYYKQTLADVLEENFAYKAIIKELQNEVAQLKEKLEENEKPE